MQAKHWKTAIPAALQLSNLGTHVGCGVAFVAAAATSLTSNRVNLPFFRFHLIGTSRTIIGVIGALTTAQ
jgi:hypothetical protein